MNLAKFQSISVLVITVIIIIECIFPFGDYVTTMFGVFGKFIGYLVGIWYVISIFSLLYRWFSK